MVGTRPDPTYCLNLVRVSNVTAESRSFQIIKTMIPKPLGKKEAIYIWELVYRYNIQFIIMMELAKTFGLIYGYPAYTQLLLFALRAIQTFQDSAFHLQRCKANALKII